MTLTMPRRLTKGVLKFLVAATAAVLALAFLAVLVLGGRLVFPLAAGLALVLVVALPAGRRWLVGEAPAARDLRHKGLLLPAGVRLHPAHAWARPAPSGGVAVGVDDLLQRALGPVAEVELPTEGTRVRRGEPLCTLSRGRRSLTLAAPVDGTVTETNPLLGVAPHLLNEAPYGDGWVARIAVDRGDDGLTRLLGGHRVEAFFRREVDRFLGALRPTAAPAMLQDGGEIAEDLHRRIDDLTWERLTRDFFGAGR